LGLAPGSNALVEAFAHQVWVCFELLFGMHLLLAQELAHLVGHVGQKVHNNLSLQCGRIDFVNSSGKFLVFPAQILLQFSDLVNKKRLFFGQVLNLLYFRLELSVICLF
jgi:hypothetical protein